jgi:hypothetical protein
MTIDLTSRETLNRDGFTNEFFGNNAAKLFRLKYCDFYTLDGDIIENDVVRVTTGINFTILQLFRIRSVCATARTQYKKNETNMQKSVDIITFLNRRRTGSSHLRKLTYPSIPETTPHNISKFASNLDIVITYDQSKFLNRLWTDNMFTSKEKTFFFKLHNNTLGYNVAVSHFVRGHAPYCTFCELAGVQEQNRETPLHIFYECVCISEILDIIYQRITNDIDFNFNSREYFATFDRRGLSFASNSILTIASKILLNYTWECKTKKFLPTLENCWAFFKEKTIILLRTSNRFKKLWTISGMQNTLP